MTEITIGAAPTQTEHKLIGIRLIDMGEVPKTRTKHKLIGRWLIDKYATLTQTELA